MTFLGIVNAVAVVVLAGITAYYAWQTRELAQEARRARLLAIFPRLVLDIDMRGPNYGEPVIRNVGTGAALDADLTLTFEGGETVQAEVRRWLAHVIAPGEQRGFLPPDDSPMMNDLVNVHPVISLRGRMLDPLGQTHDVDEQIDVEEAWARAQLSEERWIEPVPDRVIREVETIRRSWENLERRVSTLTSIAERWWKKEGG